MWWHLLLLVLPFAASYKLTASQNDDLQLYCGSNMTLPSKYHYKILNGSKATPLDAPWTAAIYIQQHKNTKIVRYTTGTIISELHVLTYQLKFIHKVDGEVLWRYTNKTVSKADCVGPDLLVPADVVHYVKAVFGTQMAADLTRPLRKVSKVTILNGCGDFTATNNIAIVEIDTALNITNTIRPVCVNISPEKWQKAKYFKFFGYGDNINQDQNSTLLLARLKPESCRNPKKNMVCALAANTATPLCNGDFGGGAIRKLKEDQVLSVMGIYVDGIQDCKEAKPKTLYHFADVGSLSGRICALTGVCRTEAHKGRSLVIHGNTKTTTKKPKTPPGPGPIIIDETQITTKKPIPGPVINGGTTKSDRENKTTTDRITIKTTPRSWPGPTLGPNQGPGPVGKNRTTASTPIPGPGSVFFGNVTNTARPGPETRYTPGSDVTERTTSRPGPGTNPNSGTSTGSDVTGSTPVTRTTRGHVTTTRPSGPKLPRPNETGNNTNGTAKPTGKETGGGTQDITIGGPNDSTTVGGQKECNGTRHIHIHIYTGKD